MKKSVKIIIACVLVAAIAVAAILLLTKPAEEKPKDRLEEVKKSGKLVIATEGNWSPWTFHDDRGALTGFDIEIGTRIAKEMGVEPEFVEAPWESLLTGVETGRFDIVCNGVGYTPTRAEKYSFSTPYVYTESVLVVRADNEDIHSMEDLKGRSTANSPNSTYAQRAEAAGANVVYVDTLGETMVMLEQGRVDATINAKGSVEDYLREHPDANIKIVVTVPGEPVAYPVRFGPESSSLVAEIDRILQMMREDGTLAALSIKYFGVDLTKAE